MRSRTIPPTTLLLALALVAGGACSTKETPATDTAAPVASPDTTARVDSAAMATGAVAHGGWTDGQILAYAAAASRAEIAEGKLAAAKATNAGVKAFARQMQSEHQTMLKDGESFAASHNITPDTTKDEVRDLAKGAQDQVKDLTDKAAGADWDKKFLDNQIEDHKSVLDKLQDAAKNTTNADLQAQLTKATGKVQEHLTKAQALKEKYPGG
jgi:putative membrane protein